MRLPRGLPKLRSLQQIKSPDTLGYMKNGNCPAFIAKYSLNYAFPISTPMKLEQDYHPCNLPLREHYETRSDPLWSFLVLGKNVSGKKATVRRWLLRRTRAAFTQALKESGYKRDGSKIPNTSSSTPELKGTLTFIIQPGVFEMNPTVLLSHTRKVLETVVEWCSKDQAKKKIERREPQKSSSKQNYKISEKRDGKQSLNRHDTGSYRSIGRYPAQDERPRWRNASSG